MNETLTDLLAAVVAADPQAPLVIDAADEPVWTTRGQLWRRVVSLSRELREHGVGRGACVALWLPNWSDYLVWQFATAALGAHVVGVNTRYGLSDVVHILDHARPVVLAVAHGFLRLDLAGLLREAMNVTSAPAPSTAVITGPAAPPPDAATLAAYDVGAGSWTPRTPAAPGQGRDAGLDLTALRGAPDELAVAFTTSGSTGRPKLAAHRGSAVARHARNVAAAGAWDASSVSLVCLPLSGVFGYVPALAAIAAGGKVLLEPAFGEDAVLSDMARFEVSHLASADDVGGRLMAAWERHPVELGAFRLMLIGDFYGNSRKVSQWIEQEIGATAAGIYGSSELFALTALWHGGDAEPPRWSGGGRVVSPDIEVRAIDIATERPVEPGTPGELQFRGYCVVDAYLGDIDGAIARRSRLDDGWFRTGDLGTVRADGGFVYLCRMGDSLRLKGFLVEPAEIENRLAEHPEVAMAKVVGITVGEETRAIGFVVPVEDAEPDPDDLVRWCAVTLARFKVPETVHVMREMPMTAGTNGMKIRAAALRELALELAAKKLENHP
ncbi:AMP-binding protein [Acrocarpospora catenulata]|uniref:AMP-binding protein n=1 Tax=Acrocarpospora catenulata TaxID=2836182 RepID=UPI001BDB41D5|nr:AMP-binding protein [Acrocarpospora catenulata]